MAVKQLILFAVLIGLAYGQTMPTLPANITLPPELEGKIDPETFEKVQNKSTEAFKKKCDENGGPDAFGKAENAFNDFKNCMQELVDMEMLNQEVEDAKPNGMVDEVFKKYCQKKPQFTTCFDKLEESVKPCLADDERKNMKTVHNVTNQLVEFICFKEGDRIALFIAEGGKECFEDKRPELEACANKTLGDEMNFDINNFASGDVPTLSFDAKQCGKMTTMQECTVKVLETCPKPTSANIVESLFKFIRNVTPCKQFTEQKGKKNDANALPVASATVAMALLTALFV